MNQALSLADALLGLFSNPQAGWFTPISIGIQGLTPEQAAQVPAPRFNSVWGVVNHVRFWQDYMLLRLHGETVDKSILGASNGWPPPPNQPTQAEWLSDQERMLTANRKLADYIGTLSDEALAQPVIPGGPTPYQVIQGLISHNSYHTCEVISIRHMLGLWLERT